MCFAAGLGGDMRDADDPDAEDEGRLHGPARRRGALPRRRRAPRHGQGRQKHPRKDHAQVSDGENEHKRTTLF